MFCFIPDNAVQSNLKSGTFPASFVGTGLVLTFSSIFRIFITVNVVNIIYINKIVNYHIVLYDRAFLTFLSNAKYRQKPNQLKVLENDNPACFNASLGKVLNMDTEKYLVCS